MIKTFVRGTRLSTLSVVFLMLTQSAVAADAPAVSKDSNVILAKNSLATVTKADFNAELRRLPEEYRGSLLLSAPRIHQLVENLLMTKSMAAQARQLKLDKSPEAQETFAWVIEKGLAQMRTEYLNAEIAAEFKSKATEFEGRAKELYKTNLDKYKTKGTVNAAHILIDLKNRSTDEALKRAQEVRKLALEGKSFDELAVQYSDDPSVKDNKGNLGNFGPGKMVKQFEDAAYNLAKPGELSEPIATQFGYHVIRLNSKTPSGVQSYEDVRAGILDGLKADFIKLRTAENLGRINSDKERQIYEDAVASIKQTVDPKLLEKKKSEQAKQ